jgi:hypothetical protein
VKVLHPSRILNAPSPWGADRRLGWTFFRELLKKQTLSLAVSSRSSLNGRMVVLVRVFGPSNVPPRVVLDWYRDGSLLRNSREVEIVAHSDGFRLWDALHAEGEMFPPRSG